VPSGSALQLQTPYIVLETPDGMLVIDSTRCTSGSLYEQLRTADIGTAS